MALFETVIDAVNIVRLWSPTKEMELEANDNFTPLIPPCFFYHHACHGQSPTPDIQLSEVDHIH